MSKKRRRQKDTYRAKNAHFQQLAPLHFDCFFPPLPILTPPVWLDYMQIRFFARSFSFQGL